jgi:hypothetical protein
MLEDRSRFSSIALKAAAHRGGDILKEVIDLCFLPGGANTTNTTNDGEEGEVQDALEISIRTQIRIVDLLRPAKDLIKISSTLYNDYTILPGHTCSRCTSGRILPAREPRPLPKRVSISIAYIIQN